MYQTYLKHDKFLASAKDQNNGQFAIVHFAGPVTYSTDGFVAKNSDELSQDRTAILRSSSNIILSVNEGNTSPVANRMPRGKTVLTMNTVLQYHTEIIHVSSIAFCCASNSI